MEEYVLQVGDIRFYVHDHALKEPLLLLGIGNDNHLYNRDGFTRDLDLQNKLGFEEVQKIHLNFMRCTHFLITQKFPWDGFRMPNEKTTADKH